MRRQAEWHAGSVTDEVTPDAHRSEALQLDGASGDRRAAGDRGSVGDVEDDVTVTVVADDPHPERALLPNADGDGGLPLE
jgi:hypothetical protein